jgi:hypothetical protein
MTKNKSEKAGSPGAPKTSVTQKTARSRTPLHGTVLDSIWNACRKTQQAAASRKAQALERLEATALELGFDKNEVGAWTAKCPQCGHTVQLYTNDVGHLSATGSDLRCAMVHKLEAYLRNRGSE